MARQQRTCSDYAPVRRQAPPELEPEPATRVVALLPLRAMLLLQTLARARLLWHLRPPPPDRPATHLTSTPSDLTRSIPSPCCCTRPLRHHPPPTPRPSNTHRTLQSSALLPLTLTPPCHLPPALRRPPCPAPLPQCTSPRPAPASPARPRTRLPHALPRGRWTALRWGAARSRERAGASLRISLPHARAPGAHYLAVAVDLRHAHAVHGLEVRPRCNWLKVRCPVPPAAPWERLRARVRLMLGHARTPAPRPCAAPASLPASRGRSESRLSAGTHQRVPAPPPASDPHVRLGGRRTGGRGSTGAGRERETSPCIRRLRPPDRARAAGARDRACRRAGECGRRTRWPRAAPPALCWCPQRYE